MPPAVALSLWIVLIVCLFNFDPAKDRRVSWAVWVPLTWLFIIGSRLPSQWIGMSDLAASAEDGNSFDRAVYLLLIALAIGVLASRPIDWKGLLTHNLALSGFVLYGLLSSFWADYTFIAFKRWFRDLGIYLAIFVVLSDTQPKAALIMLLRRLCFLLMSLSVLLVKYFPEMAKQYDEWLGSAMFSGATTSKNMLGVACLVSGVFFLWDTLDRWNQRSRGAHRWVIAVNITFIAMAIWLLNIADSATSKVCLALGALVLIAAKSRRVMRRPYILTVGIPSMICVYLLLELGFGIDIRAEIIRALGRNPTLTGRTEIWETVLGLVPNPLWGVGYEVFWLGARARAVWDRTGNYGINEAHNGYLEVYAGLGVIGLLILLVFLGSTYRTICQRIADPSSLASFSLAIWTLLLFYNVTESAFRMSQFLFVTFLLSTVVLPMNRRTSLWGDGVTRSISGSGLGARDRARRSPRVQSPSIEPKSADWWVRR